MPKAVAQDARAPEALVPTVVGRYAIYHRIAHGGMATVHLGRLLGEVGFSRTVAIKRLHPQYALDPEFVAMFLDEARLVARIRHPNVVPTLDVVSREGELFLVMEYVTGESLSSLLRAARARGERVPVGVAATILHGVLEGLEAAHDATSDRGQPLGIVHRDVTPHNVLVGSDGVPRVVDFGVAKALNQVHTTRQGEVKGKLAYMAPEQILGGPITRQVDVWASATVLWEVLTGQRLFQTDEAGNPIHKVTQADIDAPSKRVPDLPPALDAVVMKGLSREREERYKTAAAMATALEEAVPLASARRVGEWVKSLAAEAIAERAALVSNIEHASSEISLPAAQTLTSSSNPHLSAVSRSQTVTIEDAATTSESRNRIFATPTAAPGPRKRPLALPLVAAASGAVFLVGAVAFVFAARDHSPPASNMGEVTVSRISTVPATSAASPPPLMVDTPPEPVVERAAPPPSASASASAVATSRSTAPRTAAGTRPAAAPAKPGSLYSRD